VLTGWAARQLAAVRHWDRTSVAVKAVRLGLGRIVALCYRSSTSYQIR
jgi:hypothetical protein